MGGDKKSAIEEPEAPGPRRPRVGGIAASQGLSMGPQAFATPHANILPTETIPQVSGGTSVLYARPDYHLLLFSGGQDHSSVILVGCPWLSDVLVIRKKCHNLNGPL